MAIQMPTIDHHLFRTATLAGALLFSGCTLGPDFAPPASPDVKNYLSKEEAVNARQNLAAGKDIPGLWWTVFRSSALTALIDRAIKHNPDLQAAQATLTQAKETAVAKEGSLFPALDAVASGTRQQISGAQFGNPAAGSSLFSIYNTSVQVSYTLDVFGAIQRQIEGLSAQADYQRFQLEGAFLTLAANIVTTVIQEAALREQITATEDIIAAQAQQLDVIKRQVALGGASTAAVLAQQSTLAQTRTTLPPLQQQLAQTRHRLSVLVGDTPNNAPATQFTLADLHLPEQLPLSLPAKLVRQRPDVRAQEAVLHAASAQIGVVAASIFPDFTISANAGSIATEVGDLFVPGSFIWSTGANLLQPLFHGGEFLHKKRAAVAAYEQAGAQYRSTVLQAFQNVADTLSALDFDAAELKTQQAAEQTALDSLTLTQAQFDLGAVSYLALLTAERDHQQAHLGLIKAQATQLADTAALFQALGGGWWNRGNLATAIMKEHPKEKPAMPFFELLGIGN